MSWTYEQISGRLIDPDGVAQGFGYSGQPPHKNDPAAQNQVGIGPIPVGLWHATALIAVTEAHGPYVIVLTPDSATETFGRSGFLVHGDSLERAGYASEGCIVQSRDVREMFWNSADHDITVVARIGGLQ
jgi:hypothetical protein